MAKIVAIHSYRGGTGKSNICANVAAAVALQGKRVGLIDTDIPSPGIHFIFGLEQNSGVDKTLNDYLWNRCAVEDAAYDVTPIEIRNEAGLMYLIPSSVNADDIAKVLTEGYDFKKLNEAFRRFGDYTTLTTFLWTATPV
jgi:ATPases involved in chromosome partitioning